MAVDTKDSPAEQLNQLDLLPQYGFGPELSFKKLVDRNPFLFRVYTPRPLGPCFNETDPYFLGESFHAEDDESIPDVNLRPRTGAVKGRAFTASYADAVKHLDWTTKSSSPFVSTSFSFAWAVWEACRRYKLSVKHDVHIAVIDAKALVDRAVTALELLRESAPKERHNNHWRFYRFALESQDVLVYGSIPSSAVLSSIPLLSVLDVLPSYFIRPVADSAEKDRSAISRLTWEYTQKKSTYRQFCKQMSERFLRMEREDRLRDTTTGSVHLALRLLRARFYERVLDDLDASTVMVYQLAMVVAAWPGQWWVRDQPELPDLIRSIVNAVGEEIREARRVKVVAEVARLQSIVDDLEWMARDHDCASTQVGTDDETEAGLSSKPEIHIEMQETEPTTMGTASRLEQSTYVLDPRNVPQAEQSQPHAQVSSSANSGPAKPVAPALTREESENSHSSFVMTASSAVTGFIFGTFAAICILAPPRRELLHHFT
ncbi:hypothetical protein NEOLEDRAFT_1063722 [Neolentinus lepideus HHB14362 ss-1]|uniref:DUF7587 domain-containing protein n=1 Tax=Neolentinus lepideus HHB14362 ss-1 TaxID=1314782 RepID=A0A165T5M9_9AGAM|nr:hypothetical protein NEOLEDRAFT_1063722 [Neolentinus lepideus HHB14362 ss-1]